MFKYFIFLFTQVEVSSPGEREPENGLLGQPASSSIKCEKATFAENNLNDQEAAKSDIKRRTIEGKHLVTMIELLYFFNRKYKD